MADKKDNVVDMAAAVADAVEDRIYDSLDAIVSAGGTKVEYAQITGFKDGEKFRIGSVTAGDMIDWSNANEGEAKNTAGLRLICKSLVGPEPGNVRYADSPNAAKLEANINTLRKVRHKETERVVKEILKLNGMNVTAKGETKAESTAKND